MDIDVEKAVRENIERTVHLSLATTSGDSPWVSELHFAYDQDLNLYFRSLSSRRHSQEIAVNPKVAGNIIDKFGLGDPVVGVYFEGLAEIVTDADTKQIAADCLRTRLSIDSDIIAESEDPNGHQFYKIKVTDWYVFGRFVETGAAKHQLKWGNK